jgi:hypothetical protein
MTIFCAEGKISTWQMQKKKNIYIYIYIFTFLFASSNMLQFKYNRLKT